MFQVSNFTGNDDVRVLDSMGAFTTIEYIRDLSVTPQSAAMAYFCNEMNVRKRHPNSNNIQTTEIRIK